MYKTCGDCLLGSDVVVSSKMALSKVRSEINQSSASPEDAWHVLMDQAENDTFKRCENVWRAFIKWLAYIYKIWLVLLCAFLQLFL